MYVSLRRYNFVVKVIKNGRRKSKLVWSGNNGRHMSQENVIKFWVAWHPWFPDSYSVLRCPEQGNALVWISKISFLAHPKIPQSCKIKKYFEPFTNSKNTLVNRPAQLRLQTYQTFTNYINTNNLLVSTVLADMFGYIRFDYISHCYATGLRNFDIKANPDNIFWISVVTMLLNTKLPSIVTKQLAFFFAPKSTNNLFHQMFYWMVCAYNFVTKWNTWCFAKGLTEGWWWWHPETSEIAILCKQALSHIRLELSCSKNTISCLLHASVCFPIVEQIHTD